MAFFQFRIADFGLWNKIKLCFVVLIPHSATRLSDSTELAEVSSKSFRNPHYHILSGAFTPSILSALWITVFTCFMRKSLAPVLAASSVITRCLK